MDAFLPASVFAFAELLKEGEALRAVPPNAPVAEVLGATMPDVILVGTTARESFERALTLEARRREIPSVGVVDERYGHGRRFSDDNGRLRYLTDLVTVMDEECERDAAGEGIPADRLRVTGSPILSYLAYHAGAYRQSLAAGRTRPAEGWRQVAFISETFSRDNGSGPGQRGLLGPFLGFTEETVRRDLLAELEDLGLPTVLIEKLHPSDASEPVEQRIGDKLVWRQLRDADLWSLVVQSDVVVGMRSMALLEAALLGCRVASYQPNLVGEDRCAAVRFGLAAKLSNPSELKTWLTENLAAGSPWQSLRIDLPFLRRDAAERVAELVLELRRAR